MNRAVADMIKRRLIGIYYVHVPIRMTVVRSKALGGLVVYAPVAPTPECLGLLRELTDQHGPVRTIVLPSVAVEHKVLAGPFARKFPDGSAGHSSDRALFLEFESFGVPARQLDPEIAASKALHAAAARRARRRRLRWALHLAPSPSTLTGRRRRSTKICSPTCPRAS